MGDSGWVMVGDYDLDKEKEVNESGIIKPPYAIPSMSEISALPWNGYNVVSTFSGGGGSCTGYRMAGFKVLYANEFVEAAQETYAANHPTSYLDKRDIRTIQAQDILDIIKMSPGDIDIFDGSPPCFAAGTQILTRRGLIGIEEVKEGDMVVTHLGRWRKVTGTSSRVADAINVRGQGHPGITTTKEHPFYVRQSSHVWDSDSRTYKKTLGNIEWKEIGECSPNGEKGIKHKSYFWGSLRNYPDDIIPDILRTDTRTKEMPLTPELFWVVGLWLGDGWLRTGKVHVKSDSKRGEVLICASFKEADEVRDRLIAADIPFSEAEMRTTVRFTIGHMGLAEWLEEDFGRGARGKTIPYWAFGMREDFRKAMLGGYVFADGNIVSSSKYRTSSVSWNLTIGMAMIARSLGVAATVRALTRKDNAIIEGRCVNTPGMSYTVDYYEKPRSFVVENDYCWGKIKELTCAGSVMVYNIHVDEDESYIADGIIVHNCSAFSTAGKREKGWGKTKNYSDGKEQVVDDLFFEYVRLLKGLRPKVFIAENVSGLVKGTAKGYFKMILAALKECGYRVEVKLLDAQWLGVPQVRLRVIFMGVREDLGIDPVHPSPLPYRYSLRDALSELEWYRAGGYFDRWKSSDEPYGTVPADGHRLLYSAYMSANGYVMDKAGDKRKLFIPEVKRLCSFPDDYILTGTEAQQWERCGRSVMPLMAKAIGLGALEVLRKIPK